MLFPRFSPFSSCRSRQNETWYGPSWRYCLLFHNWSSKYRVSNKLETVKLRKSKIRKAIFFCYSEAQVFHYLGCGRIGSLDGKLNCTWTLQDWQNKISERFPKTIFSHFSIISVIRSTTTAYSTRFDKASKGYEFLPRDIMYNFLVMKLFFQNRNSSSIRRGLISYFQKGSSIRYSNDSVSKPLFSACLAGLHPYLYNDHLSEDVSYALHNITFYIPQPGLS